MYKSNGYRSMPRILLFIITDMLRLYLSFLRFSVSGRSAVSFTSAARLPLLPYSSEGLLNLRNCFSKSLYRIPVRSARQQQWHQRCYAQLSLEWSSERESGFLEAATPEQSMLGVIFLARFAQNPSAIISIRRRCSRKLLCPAKAK